MKVKIKGLVFVGFAAAILSANAMAANEAQTVTSKAYTEATYQHKSTAASIGNTGGTWTAVDTEVTAGATSVPTTAAVKDYVDTAIEGVTGGATSTYQTKSSDNYQIGGQDGAWADLGDGFVQGTNISIQEGQDGKLTIGAPASGTVTSGNTGLVSGGAVYDALNGAEHANFQTYSETANQISNGAGGWKDLDNVIDATTASSASAPTTAAVKTYVDSQATSAASGILTGTQSTTDTTHALTNAATTTALNNKQNLQTGDTYQVSKNGSWTAANGAVSAGAHIAKTDNADGSVTVAVDDITSAAADIDNTDTGLTTGAAVYDFVTGKIEDATGNNQIPAQNPAVCTSARPCALVNEGGTLHWYTMAQADYAGGELGDATPANP